MKHGELREANPLGLKSVDQSEKWVLIGVHLAEQGFNLSLACPDLVDIAH